MFSIKFVLNRITGEVQLVLTDTTDYTGVSSAFGFYRVEYPDGLYRDNLDVTNPDFTLASSEFVLNLRNKNGAVMLGQYRITQRIITNNGNLQDIQNITFSFKDPEPVLRDNSNTSIPQVSFRNATNLVVDGYTVLSQTQTISSDFPTGISLPPLSTTQEILEMSDSGQFYEGKYNPSLLLEIVYSANGHIVEFSSIKTFTFDIRRSPQINELVNLLNALKDRIDKSSGQEKLRLEQMYQQLVSLYSHIIAKTRVGQGGIQELINEMLKLAYSVSCCCFPDDYVYSLNPLEPFDDASFEFILRDVFEFSDSNTFELRFTPLSIFQIFRNGKLMVLEGLEYDINGRNITIIEDMEVGDEIVVYYSIVEALFLNDLSEYVIRAEAAAQLALEQAILAAAARDAAEAYALQANSSRIAAEDAADRAEVAKIEWKGPWVAGNYESRDAVGHLGSSWIANKDTNEEPSLSAQDWDLLARKGGDGVGTVTSVSGNNGITGTVTTSGNLGLTGQALALHNLSTNGLIARTGTGTVDGRTITGSTSISVTNGNGVSGNPTLSAIFGNTAGTVAEGNDSRIVNGQTAFGWGNHSIVGYALESQLHNPVTLGTPNGLSLNNQVLSLGLASGIANGALSSTDWNTFNNKYNQPTGTTSQYIRGDGSLATLNTTVVPEGTNLYFTNARARQSVSLTTTGNSGASTYNNSTGVFNIPNYTLAGLGGQPISEKGQANGYTPLDANGKVPLVHINDVILGQVRYIGTWNAATNTPTLPDPTTVKGNYYVATNSGTQFGKDFNTGDWVISDGVIWDKVDNTDAVATVFGRIGNILAVESDYEAFYPRLSQSYANPSWIASLAWSKITGTPTTLSGYGITDAVPSSRSITINGTTFDLSANRTWNVGTVTSVALSLPNIFNLTGSPITGAGTFTVSLANQSAFRVFARGTGSGVPSFINLVEGHLPNNISLGKLQNITGPTVLGRDTGSGQIQQLTGAQVLTIAGAVPTSRNINTNNGLTGGGNLTADRTLGLTGQALALHNLASNGFIVRTGAGTVAGRQLVEGTGITISLPDGVSGNPTISINTTFSDGRYVLKSGDTMSGRLNINQSDALRINGSGTGEANVAFMSFYESNTTVRQGYFGFGSGGNSDLQIVNDRSNGNLDFATVGTTRARVSSNGNFLINTTSALEGGGALQVNGVVRASNAFVVNGNDASVIIAGRNFSSIGGPEQFFVEHQLGNVRIGNLRGDLILFANGAERMRILSNGNVGIGTTAPSARLDINGVSSNSITNISNVSGIRINGNLANVGSTGITFQDGGGGGAGYMLGRDGGFGTFLSFFTNASSNAVSGAMTERVRISPGGSLLVGTTGLGAGGLLQVNGSTNSSNIHDNFGSFNVNLGSGNSEGRGIVAGFSGGSYGGIGYNVRHTTTSGTYIHPLADFASYITFSAGGFLFQGLGSGSAGRTSNFNVLASLSLNGTFSTTGDVIAFSSSDRRLKDNIKSIENPIEKILKLGGYRFDWNNKQSVYKGSDYGVIAQEVEAVFPELVQTRDNGYKAVKYEKLIPVLIEAIKELNSKIKILGGE